MAKRSPAARLHLLSTREVHTAKDGDHSDGGGLMLRVRGDSASWVLRFTAPSGRRREMGLGISHRGSAAQAGESLTTARRLAHEARELVLRGDDPIEERDRRRAAAREVEAESKRARAEEQRTLARVARAYHERIEAKFSNPKHRQQWINSLEQHVPAALWKRPIGSIKAAELIDALTKLQRELPETGSRVQQRLAAVFEDAVLRELIDRNPMTGGAKEVRRLVGRQEAGQFKALPYRVAPAFMAKLRESEGIAARCLELAVLTAARTSEALLATWSEFDLDTGVWVVPAERMKAGEPHTVYLSSKAVELIKGLQALSLHPVYLFPSPMRPDQPLSNMAMLTVLDRLGVRERTTVHGLCRATFSTWANETNVARPDVIEACLAHKEADRVRRAYNRAAFVEERRALLAAWATYLATPTESNVMPLRAA
jgi:integrase